jgi:hypothetical protein
MQDKHATNHSFVANNSLVPLQHIIWYRCKIFSGTAASNSLVPLQVETARSHCYANRAELTKQYSADVACGGALTRWRSSCMVDHRTMLLRVRISAFRLVCDLRQGLGIGISREAGITCRLVLLS